MSGLIGGAGSRSGVLGTTELEYEEGTFDVAHANYYTQTAYYRKLGDQIWIYGIIKTAAIGSNGIRSFTAPFACDAGTYSGSYKKGGANSSYGFLSIGGSSTTVNVTHTSGTSNNDELCFSMQYRV